MYIESVEYEPNDAEPGTIIWQSVPSGSEILPGEETIDVRISGVSGETMLPMPALSDYDSLEEIAAVLAAYGISDYCFRFGGGLPQFKCKHRCGSIVKRVGCGTEPECGNPRFTRVGSC